MKQMSVMGAYKNLLNRLVVKLNNEGDKARADLGGA